MEIIKGKFISEDWEMKSKISMPKHKGVSGDTSWIFKLLGWEEDAKKL